MTYKIFIQTEKGKPDSLMEPVQIMFTLTPSEPEAVTHPYDPTAIGLMSFGPDADERRSFEWQSEFAFSTYSQGSDSNGRKSCGSHGNQVYTLPRITYWKVNNVPHKPKPDPGYKPEPIWRTSPPFPREWDPSLFHPGETLTKQPIIRIANAASCAENMSMQIKCAGSSYRPILAFRPLSPKSVIETPINLQLQAYVVGSKGSFDGHILTPEDLTKPLFDKPIKSDALPWSKWRLSQGFDGKLSLTIDEETRTTSSHSFESVAKSVNDLRKELASVLTSLDITQQRLAAVETAVASNHVELSTSLNDTRNQLSRLDQVVPAVQAKMAEFETFVAGRGEGRPRPVPLVKLGVSSRDRGTRSDRGQAVAEAAKKDLVVQGLGAMIADGRPPRNDQDHLSPATTSAASTPQLPIGVTPPSQIFSVAASESTETNLPALVTAGSTGPQGSPRILQVEPVSEEVPGKVRGSFMLQESLRTLRQQVTGLERRVPALESKSDKLARQLGRTIENLTSMDSFAHDTRDQVAELELRLPVVGERVDQLTESIATTDDYLEDLASRVTAVEDRAEIFAESLMDIRESGAGSGGFSSPTHEPSARLPSGIADGPRSVVDASVRRSPPPRLSSTPPYDTGAGDQLSHVS